MITTAESSAFLFLSGEWKVVAGQSGEMIEAPFTAEGKLVGGSGKFHGISGPMVVKGTVTQDKGGVYSLAMTPAIAAR